MAEISPKQKDADDTQGQGNQGNWGDIAAQQWQQLKGRKGAGGAGQPSEKPAGSGGNGGDNQGDVAKQQERLEAGLASNQSGEANKTYEKPVNYYGQLRDSSGKLDQAKVNELAHNSSVVLNSSECTPDNIAALRKAAENDKPPHTIHIEGYISSSGFPKNPDGSHPSPQETKFLNYLKTPKPNGAGLSEEECKPSKVFEEGVQQGKDKLDARRVNETDPKIHEAYQQYLVNQAKQLKENHADGVFVDDVDNNLIKARDLARGKTVGNEKGTPNMENVLKYQRGINNHIETIAAIQAAMKEKDPSKSMTLNRGQDYSENPNNVPYGTKNNVCIGSTKEDWQTGKDGTIEPSGSRNNWTNKDGGGEAYNDTERLRAIMGGQTNRVMFEGVNQSQTDLYRSYLHTLHQSNPNAVIEYTAYRGNDAANGYVSPEVQKQNIENLYKGLPEDDKKWAREHMTIKVYNNRNLADPNCHGVEEPMTLEQYLKSQGIPFD